MSPAPEQESLPGEWESKCNEMQKMVVLRCLRQDRVLRAASGFVSVNLGQQYIEPPPFDMRESLQQSTNTTPLIFVLSPGVDPTAQLVQLGESCGVRVNDCALGQGQEGPAQRLLDKGLEEGNWVFLSNCHLMLSWMPTLEKLVESIAQGAVPAHNDFRLWLSSKPNPKFRNLNQNLDWSVLFLFEVFLLLLFLLFLFLFLVLYCCGTDSRRRR